MRKLAVLRPAITDQALADRDWTAFDQTGNYLDLPPALWPAKP
jgi:hypothetical protein